MRLIDADALLEKYGDWYIEEGTEEGYIGSLETLLSDEPTVDTEPVRHGQWITYPECLAYDGAYSDTHIVCAKCHHVWDILDNDTETFDYCPKCGAKMDGENDETA